MTVASDKLLYIISPERLLLYIISPGQKGYIVLKNNKNWSTGLKESVFPGEISYTSLSVATVIFDLCIVFAGTATLVDIFILLFTVWQTHQTLIH